MPFDFGGSSLPLKTKWLHALRHPNEAIAKRGTQQIYVDLIEIYLGQFCQSHRNLVLEWV